MKIARHNQCHFSFLEFLAKSLHFQDLILFIMANKSDTKTNLQKKDLQSNIQPSEFLAAIVHELKTPLNAIIGFSEFLKDDIGKQKSLEDCINCASEINIAAMEMNELIHDILDVQAASLSGNFSVDLSKKIDLRDIVKRSVKLNYDYSLKRGVSLETEIADNIKPINLDSKRMKQVLTNLISNAVKYSPKKTVVKIMARHAMENSQNFLEISIADQGFGMTNSQIQTAFQKYQTIQNPNSKNVDSFGLGLPITKQLIELQNGKLEVRSQVNQGTEMKLKFPYSM